MSVAVEYEVCHWRGSCYTLVSTIIVTVEVIATKMLRSSPQSGSCLIYVICRVFPVECVSMSVCFFILFFFILYPMLSVSLDCPFLIAPSVF